MLLETGLRMVSVKPVNASASNGFLEHELSPQPNSFGEGSLCGVRAEELLFEVLVGKWPLHGCPSRFVKPGIGSLDPIGFRRKLSTSRVAFRTFQADNVPALRFPRLEGHSGFPA